MKNFKFNRGWKVLVYFDLIIPAVLFIFALLFPILRVQNFFSMLFHSYNIYIVKTIPDFATLTGLIGVLYHLGAMGYALIKRNIKDFMLCLVICVIITLVFLTGLNYEIIKPLNFT